MCGVVGLRCEKDRKDLGAVASKLLRMLEYRGYDSTGALIHDSKGNITLKKDVGAPSIITKKLGIDKLSGKLFCGQVRWATFGTVTKENAQPHEVRCHTHLYGAHNGNITNCDQLKEWLTAEGHAVKSDNDGEMLVHTIEHFFAIALKKLKDPLNREQRYGALKKAILEASKKIIGSFAAVVADPVTELMACVKAGSSLYMGEGSDKAHGGFILASSDLASVLTMTKILYPIKEGEFALYTDNKADFYDLKTGAPVWKEKVRSHLKVEETELKKPFRYFMEQEIFSETGASQKVIDYFANRSPEIELAREAAEKQPILVKGLKCSAAALASITGPAKFLSEASRFMRSQGMAEAADFIKGRQPAMDKLPPGSSLADLLEELPAAGAEEKAAVKFLDSLFMLDEIGDVNTRVGEFARSLAECRANGGSPYFVACGTSYNAAKCASVFFNNIAGAHIAAYLPGDFRSQCLRALRDGDVIIGISQSGETKDLIDVFNQAKATGRRVTRINIVNNINSTLALEKSDICIPLHCGPEIAVPATKSFINQLLVLYILAVRLAERFSSEKTCAVPEKELAKHRDNMYRIPALIAATLESAGKAAEHLSHDLYLEPSMHILATGMQGIAREGALKVREVVLNHTEGFEAPEFKHGPNTILGVNTIFGMEGVGGLVNEFSDTIKYAISEKAGKHFPAESLYNIFHAVSNYAFFDLPPKGLSQDELGIFKGVFKKHNFFESMYTNYPLLFVTGPNSRDVNLTISQINTHKIRGANIYVIAEENKLLRDAAAKSVPSMYSKTYKWGYIALPKTGGDLPAFFTSSVVLQLLALHMSVRKMEFLDRLEIKDHGVHPDSPKNVSKSITVD